MDATSPDQPLVIETPPRAASDVAAPRAAQPFYIEPPANPPAPSPAMSGSGRAATTSRGQATSSPSATASRQMPSAPRIPSGPPSGTSVAPRTTTRIPAYATVPPGSRAVVVQERIDALGRRQYVVYEQAPPLAGWLQRRFGQPSPVRVTAYQAAATATEAEANRVRSAGYPAPPTAVIDPAAPPIPPGFVPGRPILNAIRARRY